MFRKKKSNGKRCKISRHKSILLNECLLTDFSKVIEINMKKGNTFIKSFLFNMLLMKYSFIFLKTYYILLTYHKKIKMLYVMTTEVKISLLYSYKFSITVLECQSLNRLFIHVQPQLIFTRRRKVLTFRSFY